MTKRDKNQYNGLKRWGYVFNSMVIMLCLGTVYSFSVFRIPIESLFGIGSTESGLPYMIALAFYAIFMFVAGGYIDKDSVRKLLMIGISLVTSGWLLSSLATNILILALTYGVVIGAGVGITYGVLLAVITQWFPDKKGLAVGIAIMGFGLSPLITAPAARVLIERYEIMEVFLMLGLIFGGLMFICSLPIRYPKSNEVLDQGGIKSKGHVHPFSTKEMIGTKAFKGLYTNFIIGTMIGLMIIGMTNNVGVIYLGLAPKRVAIFMSVFAMFNAGGRPLFGWLTDTLSVKKAMCLSYVLIALAAVMMLLVQPHQEGWFVIAFSIFWMNLGGWLAIAPAATLKLFGTKHYSRNYGVVFTAYGIGAIVGVVVSGLLIDIMNNYGVVFYFIIFLCILGALFLRGKESFR